MENITTMPKEEPEKESIFSIIKSILTILFMVLCFRSFLFEPYTIPSGSMKPTLLIGDYVFASKYPYGYSKHSFPFSPNLFEGKIFNSNKPKRGDIVIFKLPFRNNDNFVKRVIGIPGDELQMVNGEVVLNGKKFARQEIEPFYDADDSSLVTRFLETNHDNVSYETLDKFIGYGALDNTKLFVVPAGHYFVMGDNRDGSGDSRDLRSMGYIPEEYIVGRAEIVFFSAKAKWYEIWSWFSSLDSNRFFSTI